MSLPYYKKYPRDFMEGTITLTFEEKGAYSILLDLIYMRSGRLEDDARWIAGHLGCSVRLWNKVRLALISKGKISCENGYISSDDYKELVVSNRIPLARAIRGIVLARDGYTCQYCESEDGPFEIDHIYPVSKGGSDSLDNLLCACRSCNREKGSKLLSEWRFNT